LQHARKLTCHELAIALMQRTLREGNSLAFQKRKSEFVGDWCNKKGIPSAYFRYDSDFSTFMTFIHVKLYSYSIKITLATGRLINIDKLTFD